MFTLEFKFKRAQGRDLDQGRDQGRADRKFVVWIL